MRAHFYDMTLSYFHGFAEDAVVDVSYRPPRNQYMYSGSGQRFTYKTMKHFLYFLYTRALLEIAIQCQVVSYEHQVQDTCEFNT